MNDPRFSMATRWRCCAVALFIFTLFSLLIAQFYKIQITEGVQWEKKAERQHFFNISEPFHRGTFFSSNTLRKNHPETYQQLVVDIQKFHLHIDPVSIPSQHKERICEKLIALLQVPLHKRLSFYQQFLKKNRNRQLAVWLEIEKKREIAKWW